MKKNEKTINTIKHIANNAFDYLSKDDIETIKNDVIEYEYDGDMDKSAFIQMLIDYYYEYSSGEDPAEYMYEMLSDCVPEDQYNELFKVEDDNNLIGKYDVLKDKIGERVRITTTDKKEWEGDFQGTEDYGTNISYFVDVDMIGLVGFEEKDIASIVFW